MTLNENEKIEIQLLLEAILLKYGYDFRGYAQASIQRRIQKCLKAHAMKNISEMQYRILNDKSFFEELLLTLTVNVSEMFRDPWIFRAIREKVLLELASLTFLRIWLAGVANGEEVYSMAILLREAGLEKNTRIFATDINEVALSKAKEGIFPIDRIRQYTANYQAAGGAQSFADYYTARYDAAMLDSSLKKQIVFSNHNLATDGVFGEMDLIICRNVLIYFAKELQNRVVGLFSDSLAPDGYLCIGPKESLQFTNYANRFDLLMPRERIYRKKTPEANDKQEKYERWDSTLSS